MGVGEAFSPIDFCVLVERKINVSITLKILYLLSLHDNSLQYVKADSKQKKRGDKD